MYRLFNTPIWFNGLDIIFEAIILLVALCIAAYSWKIYRLNRENKFAYFSFAFILIALGLLVKTITSAHLYFTPIRDVTLGLLGPIVASQTSKVGFSDLFYRAGFFLQMAPMLGAWLLIFFISQTPK